MTPGFHLDPRGRLWYNDDVTQASHVIEGRAPFTGILYTGTHPVAWLEDSRGDLYSVRWSPDSISETITLQLELVR